MLVAAKAIALAGHDVPLSWWSPIALFWHDAAVVLAFALLETAHHGLRFPSWLREKRFVWWIYAALSLYVALNVPVTRVLSTPLTWPMWRAARGPLTDSILQYATWDNALLVAAAIALAIGAPLLISRRSLSARCRIRAEGKGLKDQTSSIGRHCHRPALSRRPFALISQCTPRLRDSYLAALIAFVLLGPLASVRVDARGLERNAWTALALTAMPRVLADTPHAATVAGLEGRSDTALVRFRGAAAGRHIILVSLESTAAQYLGLYGARPDVMPNLSALARHAIVFDHAYAVYPESIKQLFSILCSMYPAFDSDAESYASLPCTSVASVLSARGYRTALFHSGRFGYLGMESVIRHRGFELLADAGDISGQHHSSFGVDEPSTVARALQWIDGLRPNERFLVTYLPIAGHHPYDTPERGPFPDREQIDRYRNALHYSDEALGTLMRGIRDRGLEDQTLWIVFGDHGEAFGQHDGNYGHTFQIFEENVHVPLLVAAPGLIASQQRSRQVVSLVDIAPTILDLIGESAPAGYGGRSMLDGAPRMAFFFTDYSLGLLGLRDGRFKMIYEVDSGRARLFDVETDLLEQRDVSRSHGDRVGWYARNLRAWGAARLRAQ